ncbi:MAG: hypothetical protein U0521_07035 [Anaerolineae bacterium]
MRYVILPQAIRNVLPAMANNFCSAPQGHVAGIGVAVPEISYLTSWRATAFATRKVCSALSLIYADLTIVMSLGVLSGIAAARRQARGLILW